MLSQFPQVNIVRSICAGNRRRGHLASQYPVRTTGVRCLVATVMAHRALNLCTGIINFSGTLDEFSGVALGLR